MGELRSKVNGYYILTAKIGAINIQKALMESDKSFDDVKQLEDTENLLLHIPDLPLSENQEK